MDAMAEMERALGPEAVRTLVQRRLLWSGAVAANEGADAPTRLDRTTGVVLGLAAGDADGRGRVSAETQTFVLSAEAWLDHGWRAPEVLIEQLSREWDTLRVRGAAIQASVEAHRAGVPWYLGASTSYGHAALARAVAVGAVFAGESVVDRRAGVGRLRRHPRPPASDCGGGGAGRVDRRTDPTRSGRAARRRVPGRRCVVHRAGGARAVGSGPGVARRRQVPQQLPLGRACVRHVDPGRVVRLVVRRPGRGDRRGEDLAARFADGARHHGSHRRGGPRRSCASRRRGTPTSRAHRPTPGWPGG